MTAEFPHPLRLAVGSHRRGSGRGCAMNLVSYESGDQEITDLPDCADLFLARLVQSVNDTHCTHRDSDLLCPPCSIQVLDLAHRTVGTSAHGLSDLELRRVYVTIAAEAARGVLHLTREKDREVCTRAVEAAEAWAQNPCKETANAANAAAYAAAYDAANAAYDAANAAAYAAYAAANAAYAANAAAANAANAAAYAADAAADRLAQAHHYIDRFIELAHIEPRPVAPELTARAVEQMCRA